MKWIFDELRASPEPLWAQSLALAAIMIALPASVLFWAVVLGAA